VLSQLKSTQRFFSPCIATFVSLFNPVFGFAFKEWQPLAKQGNADAQNNLGAMYANGKGVLKDLSKAKYWIKKAYEGGDSKAKKTLLIIF
jgi:hypothetical protein